MKKIDILDNSKRFRDVKDTNVKNYSFVSENTTKKLIDGTRAGIFIGGYDLVNTLTTGISSSGRKTLVTQTDEGRLRYFTELEGERLQGFLDNWTAGESRSDRWFAIGNAVNCKMSEYLFTNYLKNLWW
jgi:site-specific DNA-cytosine methylase